MIYSNFVCTNGFRKKSESGYSMVELVIILLVAVVISSIAIVKFRSSRSQYELRRKAEKLVWQIEQARSLAIKYNQTLSLGFTSSNTLFGLTCDCPEATMELTTMRVPTGISLSAFPTIQIRGNGTIQTANGSIVVTDNWKYQAIINISNSGRTTLGDVQPIP